MVNKKMYDLGYRYAVLAIPVLKEEAEVIFYTKQVKYGVDRAVLEAVGHLDYIIEPIYPTEEAEAYAIIKAFERWEPTEEDLAQMLIEDEARRNNYRVKA